MDCPRQQHPVAGKTATLRCKVTADPAPELVWFKGTRQLPHGTTSPCGLPALAHIEERVGMRFFDSPGLRAGLGGCLIGSVSQGVAGHCPAVYRGKGRGL